jgi:hypothetical protein
MRLPRDCAQKETRTGSCSTGSRSGSNQRTFYRLWKRDWRGYHGSIPGHPVVYRLAYLVKLAKLHSTTHKGLLDGTCSRHVPWPAGQDGPKDKADIR